MKAYGIRKQDDACCPGHAKYSRKGMTMFGKKRAKRASAKIRDKSRKAKMRHLKIVINE